MIHLVLLGIVSVAMLIWAIKIRVWELTFTVEMPAKAKEEPAAEPESPPQ